MKKILASILGLTLGILIGYGAVRVFLPSPSNKSVLAHTPKYKAGDCVAYYMYGKHFEAKEEWEESRDLPAFMTLEIIKVGQEKYLVNTRYRKSSPAPFRPNEGQWIKTVDRDDEYEKIDCANVESVLESKD